MKIKLCFVVIISILYFSGCSEETVQPDDNLKEDRNKEAALVIAVENADGDFSGFELILNNYRDVAETIFADIFDVDKSELTGKSVDEIIETIGEDWQIKTLKETGESYYKEIVVLTDDNHTMDNMISELERLNPKYDIDMIFCMHGNKNVILFDNGSIPLSELTGKLEERDITLRMIYQTNCYGKYSFDYWAKTNIKAINGAEEINRITIFSPQYFLQNWISGKPFKECVNSAYSMEIEKFRSYKDILPVIELVLTDQFLASSKQYTGGSNPMITKDFYEK